MFFNRKPEPERIGDDDPQYQERLDRAQAEIHNLKLRRATAERRIDERIRRNHISDAVAELINGPAKGARG